jgi:GGDEF domain-containing protein
LLKGVVSRPLTEEALALCKRIVAAVEQPVKLPSGPIVTVGISVGHASFSTASYTAEALMAQADRALYASKRTSLARNKRTGKANF